MLTMLMNELMGPGWHQHATFLLLVVQCVFTLTIILYLRRSANSRHRQQSAADKAQRLADFQPEPLVPPTSDASHRALRPRLISGRVGLRLCVDGVDCLNMASLNFLGLLENSNAADGRGDGDEAAAALSDSDRVAIECIHKNGVGSCGPRGFYGTNDVHLQLEEQLARFMRCEEAAIYAYGFSALASAIPSYCKRGDLVFADERVNFAIQTGLLRSRSTIVYFKHNDADDLERLLVEQQQRDRRHPKKAAAQRRFLITEAIFHNTGEMCPLRRLVELRAAHKLRFILDESLSIGCVGATGRGLTELLDVDLKEVDLIIGSLENAVGSIGGFCVGTTYIVDHQRLSGLGYCFSASTPPFLAQIALHSVQRLAREPQMVGQLEATARAVHEALGALTGLRVGGAVASPIKHLYVKHEAGTAAVDSTAAAADDKAIRQIVDECTVEGLALVAAEYLEQKEAQPQPPSIRIAVNRLLSAADIRFAFETLERVSQRVLQGQ